MSTAYENLEVYKLSFQVALKVHALSRGFPNYEQYGGLADQMRRSSKSICANLGEGLSKHMSPADESRFLSIAMGSCEETRVWMAFAIELGYCSPADGQRLRDDFQRISGMLFGLLRKRKAVV